MMRVMPRTAVSRLPPTAAISSDTVSDAWTCIHKKVMGTVPVFLGQEHDQADRDEAGDTDRNPG